MTFTSTIPARLAEIVSDFQISEGQEKLELLLQYADSLKPLPAHFTDGQAVLEAVPECMTPVAVTAEMVGGGMNFYFLVPEESPTVRGYAALIAEGLQGASPEQVIALPPDFYLQMGLQKVLTNQRLNGMAAIIAHVKRLAVKNLS
jgi:cysteine desulfuration protein SufE